jgi:multidrug efflux pump
MGGLILSQVFTLYTTPVIYLYPDRLRARLANWSSRLPWNQTPGGPDTAA